VNVGDQVLVPGVVERIVPPKPGFPEPCIVVRLGDASIVFAADQVTTANCEVRP